MSPGITALPMQNGAAVEPQDAQRVNEFYNKLFRLRDDVLAGRHERIRLPARALEQVAARSGQQTPSLPNRPSTNGAPAAPSVPHPLPPRPDNKNAQSTSSNGNFVTSLNPQQRSFPAARSTSTAIDPRLLTKSDTLIRAELQLKRNNIERLLNDEVEKRNHNRDAGDDTRIDVMDILEKALERVKPISGLQSPTNGSESTGSFDENSYYSSKANSWSSSVDADANTANGADATQTEIVATEASATDKQLTVAKPNALNYPEPVQGDTSLIDLEEEAYEPADVIDIYESPKNGEEPEDQESEYSPPPADITPEDSCNAPTPTESGGPPSRRNGNRSSRRQSPVGRPRPIRMSKKRRREENREKRDSFGMPAARSPQQLIKEESVSPPPLRSLSDLQPNKRQRRENGRERGLQPLSSEVEAVPARATPRQVREQEPPLRAYRRQEEPQSPTVIHVPQRRLERDEQDLRRVASLQYARRPYSPIQTEPTGYLSDVREPRAASRALIDRAAEPIYHDISARPSAVPRGLRERSRSPVQEYLTRPQSPLIMAPPSRRIVVDQYGNRFYAEPIAVRESAAPPARRIEPEVYYERAVTREPAMRAASRAELYEDLADVRRMGPPPPRRFVEHADVEMIEPGYAPRTVRALEPEYAPAREVVERRPIIQYEEMGPPREYVQSRAYSVRPEAVRREPVAEYAPLRHESLQPGYVRAPAPRYREISVVAEQLPHDDRRYTMAPPAQGRRYVDDGGYVERPIEVADQPIPRETRRVSYRY